MRGSPVTPLQKNIFAHKKLKKVEKIGIITTKCSERTTSLVTFGLLQSNPKFILLQLQARCQGGGAWGASAPPVFGRSVNPISTRGGTLSPPSTTSPPPGFSDLSTALNYVYFSLHLPLQCFSIPIFSPI